MRSQPVIRPLDGRAALAAILLLGASAGIDVQAQTVYRTIDEAGNVAYTDRPPLMVDTGESRTDVVDVEIRRTDRADVRANLEERARQTRAADVAGEIREDQEAEQAAVAARNAEVQQQNCSLARERLQKYTDAWRLYRELPDGEREYLSDDQIDTERANAARAVEEFCAG